MAGDQIINILAKFKIMYLIIMSVSLMPNKINGSKASNPMFDRRMFSPIEFRFFFFFFPTKGRFIVVIIITAISE